MRNNNKVIPTIFAYTKKDFTRRFNILTKIAKNLQIDFMDGNLVKSKSISLNEIPNLNKYDNIFEAHLMVKNPLSWINKCNGFSKIIFHIEAVQDKEEADLLMEKIKDRRMKAFVAINPETPIENILPIAREERVDGILLMGVHPGKEGQELEANIFERIKRIKRINPALIVQVDGGINNETISKIFSAGADIVNAGSYVGKAKNPGEALEKLEELAEK